MLHSLIRVQLVTCDNRSTSIGTRSAQRPGRPRSESARGRFTERYYLTKLKTHNTASDAGAACPRLNCNRPAKYYQPLSITIGTLRRVLIIAFYVAIVSIVLLIKENAPRSVLSVKNACLTPFMH